MISLRNDRPSVPPAPTEPPQHHTCALEPAPSPSEFARLHLNFKPDPKQIQILDSPAKRVILNCSRQWGKSTVAAIKAVHLAHTIPNQLILIASPGERQSTLLLAKARKLAIELGHTPKSDGENKLSLRFPGGSRIVALPGSADTIRGFSGVNLLVVDEAAYVPEELYNALLPMLIVSDGDLWLLSTPFGKRGFFYQEWTQGSPDWHRIEVPATECPRIRPELLHRHRTAPNQDWFNQEFMCQFVGIGGQYFDPDIIDAAVADHKPFIGRR